MKTILSLENKEIPPSLHYERSNPEIDFESSPFFVNTKAVDWPAGGAPRRAGISSFGFGGSEFGNPSEARSFPESAIGLYLGCQA